MNTLRGRTPYTAYIAVLFYLVHLLLVSDSCQLLLNFAIKVLQF